MTAAIDPSRPTRKAEALAFIEAFLTEKGHSPTMGQIAQALNPRVSLTRAKALVHALARDKAIQRAPGAQRGISVPGLAERNAIAMLRARGAKVDEDFRRADPPQQGFPKGHLPIVAVIAHIPAPGGSGESDDHDRCGRAGAAAGGASGAGAATTPRGEGERTA